MTMNFRIQLHGNKQTQCAGRKERCSAEMKLKLSLQKESKHILSKLHAFYCLQCDGCYVVHYLLGIGLVE